MYNVRVIENGYLSEIKCNTLDEIRHLLLVYKNSGHDPNIINIYKVDNTQDEQ